MGGDDRLSEGGAEHHRGAHARSADGEREAGDVRVRGGGKAQDGESLDCGRAGKRGAGAESSAEEGGDARAEQTSGGLRREEQAEAEGVDAETIVREEGEYGLHGEEGDVPDRRTQREPEQQPIPEYVRGAGPRLPQQRLTGLRYGPGRGRQRPYEQCGERERDRVGEQRNHPPEREQGTARGRSGEAGRGGLGAAQAGVGALQERGVAAEQIR